MNRKLKNEELNRLTTDEFKGSEKIPVIIILDNIRSLNNIGSVFRTADAFRVESIYLCGITACPPNKEIHKTALGATETVNWKYFEKTIDAIKFLKNQNVLIISIEQAENSIELQDFKIEMNKKYALIFGNEVKGVEQDAVNLSDYCVEIPQFGTKHSFNISVSVGIVLWDLFLKISR
ncbi:MAG: RNA methyltransferase [Bacteroidetes bacterium GWA2_30_7]|nr:MAG: RNA methyltransferase [Bacteroidetes bacterium GWA2_30_7]